MTTRIVIVTYNWPPRNAIGTHRVYAWARYWAEAGAQVTVLTAEKQPFDTPLDLDLPTPSGVRVIEVKYGGAARLAGRALKLELPRRLAKAVKARVNRWSATPIDPRSRWRRAVKSTTLDKIADWADIVVSTYSPAAAHLIASDLKQRNPALRWVADYRDLWTQCHSTGITEAAREAMWKEEMATVGERADMLTTVSDDLVNQLAEFMGKQVLRVPNGFDIDEDTVRSRLAARPRAPGMPVRIVYTGMLYDGLRDPRPLFDALNKLYNDGHLQEGDITVDFYGSRLEPLRRLVQDSSYARFVRIMGHVPRQKAMEAQRNADLLLLLESPLPEARGVLTGKVFEYIASGRPILCIGSRPEFDIGRVLNATGTGMVFGPDEYADISKVLIDTLSGEGLYEAYAPNIHHILTYSRERIAKDMLLRIAE